MADARVIAALIVAAPAAAASAAPPLPAAETIGVARQEVDGTIVVQLRTPSDSGMTGDAIVRYAPGDPNYAVVAHHIGPIPPGESVFVTRFDE